MAARRAWAEQLEERRLLSATMLTNVLSTNSSNPSPIVAVNGAGYLTTTDFGGTYSLWRSDGSDAGTSLVGTYRGAGPAGLTASNGKLFYEAVGSVTSPRELFVTDGTPADTQQLTNFAYTGATETGLIDAGGTLYFVVDQGNIARELWKSDGTVAGTVQVATWSTPGGGPSAGSLADVNGTVFFTVPSFAHGPELWKTDGTAAGTQEVIDVNASNPNAILNELTNVNGTLFFAADDGTHGNELWKSDGTAAGTTIVADINAGAGAGTTDGAGSWPSNLTALGNTLYFTANDGAHGMQLWRSDGTPTGTSQVSNINPGIGISPRAYLLAANGALYFSADDGVHGAELWKSDGTTSDTVQVADINPGGGSATPSSLVPFGGGVLFAANDGTHGNELWKSDGTAAGTTLVQDIWPGATSANPISLVNIGPRILFTAADPLHSQQLWTTDGTAAGTYMVRDLTPTAAGTNPNELFALGDQLIFCVNSGPTKGIWTTDGTSAGTVELSAGTLIDEAVEPVVAGGIGYFVNDGNLWKTDGTPTGTRLVAQFGTTVALGITGPLTAMGGRVFFTGLTALTGQQLWTSDGTAAGTYEVTENGTTTGPSNPMNLTNVDGTLFFTSGDVLYKTDGTPTGTVAVTSELINAGSFDHYFHALNGLLLFAAQSGGRFYGLLRSDGTAAGTVPIAPLVGWTVFDDMYVSNGEAYFAANDTSGNISIWKTDGTDAGTTIIQTLGNINATRVGSPEFLNVNGTVYFSGTDPRTLWKTDDTPAGAVQVAAFPTAPSHDVENLVNADGTLYFLDNFHVFTSDGTAAGTVEVDDSPLNPTMAVGLVPVDGQVFFDDTTAQYADQLWEITPPITPPPPAAPSGINAAAASGGEIDLTWADPSNQVGFRIDRSTDPAFGTIDRSVTIPDATRTRYADTTVQPGVTYYYRVTAYNRGGVALSSVASVSTPAVPLAPTALTAALFPTHIDLSWADNSSDEAGFRIERSAYADFRSIQSTFTVAPNVTSFSDTTVTPTSAYFYRVSAFNSGGTSGAAVVRAVTPDLASANVIAIGVSNTEIDLQWTTPSTTQLYFEIYRSTAGGTRAMIGYATASQTSYSDITVPAFGTYTYTIEQIGAWGTSYSTPVSATTEAPQLTTLVHLLPNVTDSLPPSAPSAIVTSNGIGYFVGYDDVHGRELWRTDGTAQGTTLVKDLYPGFQGSGIQDMTDVNGVLYFVAADPSGMGSDLWKSNGTASGTTNIKVLDPYGYATHDLVHFNGMLYFRGEGVGAASDALWKSDGTAAGTVLVKDFAPQPLQAVYNSMTVANGKLFLAGNTAAGTSTLFVSDGTAAGTTQVLPDASAPRDIVDFVPTANGVFFVSEYETTALWFSDGTDAGTHPITTVAPLSYSSSGPILTNVNGTLYFLASGTNGLEVWKSDGSNAGTTKVADSPTAGSPVLTAAGALGNRYVYTLAHGNTSDIWATDAAGTGVSLLLEYTSDPPSLGQPPNTGPAGVTPSAAFNGSLYFFAEQAGHQWDLYKSDGTAAGTTVLQAFAGWEPPENFAVYNGALTFAADDGVHGLEPWRTDGTPAGTYLIKDVNFHTPNAQPDSMVNAGPGTVFFTSSSSADNNFGSGGMPEELWKTDGTSAGTTRVATLPIANLFAVGNDVYFAGTTVSAGSELWRSDGTAAGTFMVKDINPGVGSSSPLPLGDLNGMLIFGVPTGAPGDYQLWRSDGTNAGTVQIGDVTLHMFAAADNRPGPDYAVSNGVFYFVSNAGGIGYELWRTDGTAAGTSEVVALNPGATKGAEPSDLVEASGALYFTALDPTNGDTLFRTDGTAGNTVALLAAPSVSSITAAPAGHVDFVTADASTGAKLWTTDGTPAGTTMLKDIVVGAQSTSLAYLTLVGTSVDFLALDQSGNNGLLYTTDGTPAGTRPVRAFQNVNVNAPVFLANAGGTLFFADGWHLWRSDGTIAGTAQVMEITPQTGLTPKTVFTGAPYAAIGGNLLFSAYDPSFGRDLRLAAGTPPAAPTGLSLSGGSAAPAVASPSSAIAPLATSPITLQWASASANTRAFIIDRATNPTFTAGLSSFYVPAGTTTYIDSSAQAGVAYYYRVRAIDAAGSSPASNTASNALIQAATRIADGSPQRSVVRTVTITFSAPVALAPGAIALSRRNTGGSGANNGGAPTDLSAYVTVANPSGDGMAWVIGFSPNTPAADATGGLADGIYDLTIHAAGVTPVHGGRLADQTITFHRLFGDINGDAQVNNADYFLFRKAFNTAATDPAFNPWFDYNADGAVGNLDYFQFRKRFLTAFNY